MSIDNENNKLIKGDVSSETEENLILAQRLKEARKRRGVKVSTIIKHLEIARSTYTNYEMGHRTPPPNRLSKIAEYLEVSTDYLLGITDNENSAAQMDNLLKILNSTNNLHWNGRKITEDQMKQLISIIDSYYTHAPENKKDSQE